MSNPPLTLVLDRKCFFCEIEKTIPEVGGLVFVSGSVDCDKPKEVCISVTSLCAEQGCKNNNNSEVKARSRVLLIKDCEDKCQVTASEYYHSVESIYNIHLKHMFHDGF